MIASQSTTIDFVATAELAMLGIRNELSHRINSTRKKAGCSVNERVVCYISPANGFIEHCIENYESYIKRECLIDQLVLTHDSKYETRIGIKEFLSIVPESATNSVVTKVNNTILFGIHNDGEVFDNYWEAL